MAIAYTIHVVDPAATLPAREFLSAAFLIALSGNSLLAIRNEVGWDIPGGHLENGETPLEGLAREVREEAGAGFENPKLFVLITSDADNHYRDKVMLIYAADNFTLGTFSPAQDALERTVMGVEEFLGKYHGDKAFMQELIEGARKVLAE